jgi:hypothetical protein
MFEKGERPDHSPPFALSLERYAPAFLILAHHLAVFVARRFFGAFVAVVLP